MGLQLSPLESTILRYLLREGLDNTGTEHLEVTSRQLTPCGRFVELRGSGLKKEGCLQVEMDGIPNGITADLWIRDTGSGVLEIVVNGGDTWDGQERSFRISGGSDD
jgi:hypothetical protein